MSGIPGNALPVHLQTSKAAMSLKVLDLVSELTIFTVQNLTSVFYRQMNTLSQTIVLSFINCKNQIFLDFLFLIHA